MLFLKAPRRGQVKRRLAREIGEAEAVRLQKAMAEVLLRRLGHDGRWRLWLAVTPDSLYAHAFRRHHQGPRLKQGPGDLGARMARCFDLLPPGPAVLIGSDIPDLSPRHIADAFRRLESCDAVFGPAADGGYWLVGLARRRREPGIFGTVRWSSPSALADTLAHFKGRAVGFVETLADIDDAAGLADWRDRQKRQRRRG